MAFVFRNGCVVSHLNHPVEYMNNATIKARAINFAKQCGSEPITYEFIAKIAYGREADTNELAYVTSVLRENNLPYLLESTPIIFQENFIESEEMSYAGASMDVEDEESIF